MESFSKKELGAYYTPYPAAKVLADWAILGSEDRILEPSFGGCKFLKACKDKLLDIGSSDPLSNIFGYDIDEYAFETYLYGEMEVSRNSKNFIKKSFLDSTEKDFNSKFDVVIGNPPYISYHAMSDLNREKSRVIHKEWGEDVKGNFSMWLPFVVKSLSFLKKGGRIAFVLPSAIVESYYSKGLIKYLQNNFSEVIIANLKERLFKQHGTNEISYILLCKGYKEESENEISHIRAIDISDLKNKINKKCPVIENESKLLFEGFFAKTEKKNVASIGELFDVRIGVVTGFNDFFIINKDLLLKYKLDKKDFPLIIKNKKNIPGLILTSNDVGASYESNENIVLFTYDKFDHIPYQIKSYLDSISPEIIDTNKTFKKRRPWYNVSYGDIPSFFMTYMTAFGPKFVINNANVTCTNSLFRLYERTRLSDKEKLLYAMSIQTSFSQLSAELVSKRYGSGVLKIEPTAARSIRLLRYTGRKNIRGLRSVFEQMNSFIYKNEYEAATALADELFSSSYPSRQTILDIREALSAIRSYRYLSKK